MESLAIRHFGARRLSASALAALLVAGAVAAAPAMAPVPALARLAPEGFADLVEQVSPAVVQISAKQTATAGGVSGPDAPSLPEQFREGPFKEFFDRYFKDRDPQEFQGPRAERGAVGSGFIVDTSGIVVTNNHVVGSAKEITVTFNDGTEMPAKLLGADDKTDLAVLKVESDKPLPAVAWGDSDKARVGDWVLAVGNPFGLGGTATVGIVSARGRDIGTGPYDDFIQIDAPLNSGNSGGPLFDRDGSVIGVNTAIYSPNGGNVGIGFAIPAELARQVVAQLRDKGLVERGWLGVRIQPVTPDIAESLGLDKAEGALIAGVSAGSPAEKAGLRPGDVILGFAGEKVETLRDLTRAAADAEIGSDVRLEVWRGEKQTTVDVEIGEAPRQVAAATRDGGDGIEVDSLGLVVAGLDDDARARYGFDESVEGVVIADVKFESDAAEKGLRTGDLITRVNQREIATPAELAEAVAQAEQAQRKAVLLLVERQGEQRFVAVEIARA